MPTIARVCASELRVCAVNLVECVPDLVDSAGKPDVWPTLVEILEAQTESLSDAPVRLHEREDGVWVDHRDRVWVPNVNDLPIRVCVVAHAGSAGHRGIDATYQRVSERFVWEDMKELVREFVKACQVV